MENKIRELLEKMTVEEKIGQLNQVGVSLAGTFDLDADELMNMVFDGKMTKEELMGLLSSGERDYHEEELRQGKVGSYIGALGVEKFQELQRIAVEETRLGIPILVCNDVIHGFRTVVPIPLGESCSWDEDLWERTARMSAREATAAGIKLTFAPMVDVSKDARWGRIAESAGEDVLINGRFGAAKVRGFQTEDPSDPEAMAACIKHFGAYGAVEGGRDYGRVDMSQQRLFEEYLPSYKACVDAGALSLMPAFNDINGEPCSANDWLLTEVLRKQWGFKGATISDSNAVAELVAHGKAEDRKEAAKLALEAGMDMDMSSGCFLENLGELAQKDNLDMEALDRAVEDVLRLKLALGLFDDPYQTSPERYESAILTEDSRRLAREAARKSMVLLKNEGVLPLKKSQKIGIVGKLAASREDMPGTWALDADVASCVTLVDACSQRGISFRYFESGEEAVSSECEIVVAAVGETRLENGEAASKSCIDLSEEDRKLIRALKDGGKKVIAALFCGRPMAVGELKEAADALLVCWHPGTEGGNALADLLFGIVSPSGKLTATFPENAGQCPLYYDHINTGRPAGRGKFTSKYIDSSVDPVYPFGYGLSYTTFTYSHLQVTVQSEAVSVSVKVRNEGERAADEIVQCYFRDPVAKRVRPVRKLTDFARISLIPGEEKTVQFTLPKKTFGYYDRDMHFVTDPGKIELMVGGNPLELLREEIEII